MVATGLASARDLPARAALRQPARPHRCPPQGRGLARRAVGRPRDPGRSSSPARGCARRAGGRVGLPGRGAGRRPGAARRAGRGGLVRSGRRSGARAGREARSGSRCAGCCRTSPPTASTRRRCSSTPWAWPSGCYATRFCPRCGGVARAVRSPGHELVCTQCGRSQFPRTDPAVIMLVTAGEAGADDERCLLGRQASGREGRFSTLAGFCEPGETLEDAVRREVAEEVGVRVGAVDYFGNQPWPLPASLMIGFFGRAETTDIQVDERRDRGRPLVHPRRDEGRGRGGHAGAARRRLDLPLARRALVRRPAARPLVSRAAERGSGREAASFSLTCSSDGLVWARAVGVDQRRHGLVAVVGRLDDRRPPRGAARCRRPRSRCPRGRAALEAVAVAAPGGGVHRERAGV